MYINPYFSQILNTRMCVQRYKHVGICFVTLCLQLQCITGRTACGPGTFSRSGNQCDSGYYEYTSFSCLQFILTTNTHSGQEDVCSALNGEIAMFSTSDEKTQLRDFPKWSGHCCNKDLFLKQKKGGGWPGWWKTSDFWGSGQPSGGSEECLELRDENKLNDQGCDHFHSTVCKQNFQCNNCLTCGNNQRQTTACSTTSNRVCELCGSGKYKADATTCSQCRENCGNTERETQGCSTTGNRLCTACLGGTYKSNGVTCSNCHSECSASQKETQQCTASSNRVCQVCDPGYYKSSTSECSACHVCAAGHRETVSCTASSNRICVICSGDTYKDSDVSCADCLVCTAGQEPTVACSSTSNRQCQSCIAGKFKANSGNNACSNCPLNSNSVAGATACFCKPGFEGNSAESCMLCQIGKFKSNSGNSECSPCEPNKFAFTTGSSICRAVTCPVQQFVSTVVSNVARTCGDGQNIACAATLNYVNPQHPASYGNDGNDIGNFVLSGSVTVGTPIVFTIDFGKQEIIQFIMFYNRNELCCRDYVNGATIRIGQTSAWADSTVCETLNSENVQTLDCNLQGRYIFLVLQVSSVSTILNFYELKAFSACSKCPSLSSAPQGSIFSTSCTCNSGYVGQNGGVCSECAAGKYKTAGLTCTDCPTGTYSSLSARNALSDCLLCQSGKYADFSGLTICKDCEAGKSQQSTGQAQCQSCPQKQASGNAFSTCVLCDVGKYWLAATNLCTICAGSTYKTQTGSAMCQSCIGDSVFISVNVECTPLTQNCMSGYYYEGLNCVRCPNNHTTPVNPAIYYRNSCLCLPGFERRLETSDLQCIPCNQGFYSSNIGMSCIPSPKGTFVNVPGSISYTKCPKNWVSLVEASTSCTQCPSTSYSTHQNTLCMPGNENNLAPSLQQQFKISVFCVDVEQFGLKPGFVTMEKQSGVTWDSFKQDISFFYANFVNETTHFSTPSCNINYLYTTPTACGVNTFMMRIHSYIWECVSCPTGTYKDTLSLSYTDCKACSGNFCPQLEQTCHARNDVYIPPSYPMYTNYFKNSD